MGMFYGDFDDDELSDLVINQQDGEIKRLNDRICQLEKQLEDCHIYIESVLKPLIEKDK